jgi:hypothetical protein
MSTSYYERVLKTRKAIIDNYIFGNKILRNEDINVISDSGILNQNNNLKK